MIDENESARRKLKEQFASRVIARFRRKGWAGDIRYDEDRFALGFSGPSGTLYLANAFAEWQEAEPAERAGVIDRFVLSFHDGDSDTIPFETAAPLLLPVMRNRVHAQHHRLTVEAGSVTGDLPFRVFAPTLAVGVAVDRPDSISFVTADRLKGWKVSFEEALAVAMENLRARSPCRFERIGEGFYVSSYDDSYDAARILLPHLFEQLPLRGDPVAAVISRSMIAVAGSQDIPVLNAMATVVEEAFRGENRPISCRLLVLRDGRWDLFQPADTDLPAIHRLRVLQEVWDTELQKGILEAHFKSIGRDVDVARLHVFEHEGRPYTAAIWPVGKATLLPAADAIGIQVLAGHGVYVRHWAQIEALCGGFPMEPDAYPPRHVVDLNPTRDDLVRLLETEEPFWLPPTAPP